jgi:HSP20 family protein
VENGTVRISGKTADERTAEEGSYVLQEIRRGNFSRTVTLPTGLEPDKATASFEHGILRLQIPKAEQVKPRQIKISAVSDGNGRRTSDDRPAELKA